jgi:hypothetical protein
MISYDDETEKFMINDACINVITEYNGYVSFVNISGLVKSDKSALMSAILNIGKDHEQHKFA